MMKAIKILSILILVLILIAAFFRQELCRFLICNNLSRATGLKLSIEDLNLDILNNSLRMCGITLFSPPGFKNEVIGEAGEIFIKYDLWGSYKQEGLHLRRVKANIKEINIITNEKGKSNIGAFKKWGAKPESPSVTASILDAPDEPPSKMLRKKRKTHSRFLIDRLELSLGKITFINYNAGLGQPAVIIFTGKGPWVFKNIGNLGYVVDSVSAKEGFGDLLNNLY